MKKILLFLFLIIISITFSSCIFSSDLSIEDISFFGRGEFKWGTGINPYPNGVHTEEVLNQVLDNAKELGIKWIRFEVSNGEKPFDFSDPIIKKIREKGLNVVIGFQPSQPFEEMDKPYDIGYKQANDIAKHYPEVSYFQLANEPATGALKPNWPGIDENSFDKDKYQKILDWLKGASDGIKKANYRGKRIITGHWLHFGFFQMLSRDKLNYEIIGWDWHQPNYDLTNVASQGKNFNIIEELAKTKKELWITEAGIIEGSHQGEDKQAEYNDKLAKQVYESGKFSGFFIFSLYDEMHKVGTKDEGLGIIGLKKDQSGAYLPGDHKKAYYSYQEIIKQLSKK